jgi:hypothetical protein
MHKQLICLLSAICCITIFGCSNTSRDITSSGSLNNQPIQDASLKSKLVALGLKEELLVERKNDFIYDGDMVIRKMNIDKMIGSSLGLRKTLQLRWSSYLNNSKVNDMYIQIDASLASWTSDINEAITSWNNSVSNIHYTVVTSSPDITIYSDLSPNCPDPFDSLDESTVGLANLPGDYQTPGEYISLHFNHPYLANVAQRRGVITHELGHTFGLQHTDHSQDESDILIPGTPTTDNSSIMVTYANPAYTSQSSWDYGAVQILYPINQYAWASYILGIGTDYKLYLRASINSRWVPYMANRVGDVRGLAVNCDRSLIGIGTNRKLYTRTQLNYDWVIVSNLVGDVESIALMYNGTLVGVGTDHKLYTRASLNSNWVRVSNLVGDVLAVTVMPNQTLLGVGTDKKLYTRATLNSNWVAVSNRNGDVTNISVMDDGVILGVGTNKKLYTRQTVNSNWVLTSNLVGDVICVHYGLCR